MPGESPGVFFGRGWLIREIFGFAENPIPIAFIGAGGIGETSITLAFLQDNRIEQQFGNSRQSIRCDFLRRSSDVVGPDIKTSKGLARFRLSLSSREAFIVPDTVVCKTITRFSKITHRIFCLQIDPGATGTSDL